MSGRVCGGWQRLPDKAFSGRLCRKQSGVGRDTAFTIDKTPPVIRMEIDAGDAENGKYYRTAQDVTFSVEDNNINTENAAVYIQKEELEVWQEEKTENRSKEETISLRPMGRKHLSGGKAL